MNGQKYIFPQGIHTSLSADHCLVQDCLACENQAVCPFSVSLALLFPKTVLFEGNPGWLGIYTPLLFAGLGNAILIYNLFKCPLEALWKRFGTNAGACKQCTEQTYIDSGSKLNQPWIDFGSNLHRTSIDRGFLSPYCNFQLVEGPNRIPNRTNELYRATKSIASSCNLGICSVAGYMAL